MNEKKKKECAVIDINAKIKEKKEHREKLISKSIKKLAKEITRKWTNN